MGGGVGLNSPFHQQSCVAAATVLGGAVGGFAGAGPLSIPGAVYGAAVGFVLGQVICTSAPIDRFFKDKLDFENGLRDFGASPSGTGTALDKLSALPTVPSRDHAAIVLRFTIQVAQDRSSEFWQVANEYRGKTMSGDALQGITSLSNSAEQILASQSV